MALDFYEAYRRRLMRSPVNEWRENTQQMILDTWDDTSTVETVSGQTALGGTTYANESVQLNSVIDPKTGNPFGDDYRKIIYKVLADNLINEDLTLTTRFLGKYYQFSNYTWLTINTNTVIGSNASAVLQKCNNTLKWYDGDKVLHQWPCVFQRTLSSTSVDDGSEGVKEVSADTLIKVQRNSETATISNNQRFIFNGHAFQVKQINNHVSSSYMEIYMFETQVQANDDITNNIANAPKQAKPSVTQTLILPALNKILQGNTQSFNVYKYINGVKTSDTYSVQVTGAVSGVNYNLTIVDGNNFTIQNLLQNNTPITITCTNTDDSTDTAIANILLGGVW